MLEFDEYVAEYAWESVADPYESIREILHPSFESASPEDIEAVIWEVFGDVDVNELEGFLDDLKRFGQRIVQRAPSILTGAASGAAAGGATGSIIPGWGTAVGAIVGGLLGGGKALAGSAPQRPSHRTAAPAPPAARPPTTTGSAPRATTATTNPAAAALIGLLMRPEVMQALMALAAGPNGRRAVPVGEYEVPSEVFLTTIREVAEEAEETHLAGGLDAESATELRAAPPRSQASALIDLIAGTEMVDEFETLEWLMSEFDYDDDPDEIYPGDLVEAEFESELGWVGTV